MIVLSIIWPAQRVNVVVPGNATTACARKGNQFTLRPSKLQTTESSKAYRRTDGGETQKTAAPARALRSPNSCSIRARDRLEVEEAAA